ncbi:MAG: hypothetical protein V4574_15205 [Pseudomonadota bacterium]
MAYREKLAAVGFASMALVYGVYFTLVATRPPVPHLIDMLWLFGIAAPIHALLYALGMFAIRLPNWKEGAAPPDERDRAIARRGRSIAYLVLLAGTILVGVVMPFSEAPGKIVNAALFAIVAAELVNDGVVLISYRRGWHG